MLIIATIAGLAWWAQARHDAANTGRAYGHGDFRGNVTIAEFTGPCPVEMSYGPTVGDVDGDGKAEILVVWGGPCACDSIKPGWYWYGYISLYRYSNGSFTTLAQREWTGPVDGGRGLFDCAPALCDVGIKGGPGQINNVPDVISATGVEGVVYACEIAPVNPDFYDVIWSYTASNITFDPSSPKVADLNGDGIHDVVIGGFSGGKEGEGKGPNYLYALNGATGSPLWIYQVNGPVYATPAIGDVNGDGNPEVVFTSGGGLFILGDAGLPNPRLLASFSCAPVGSPVLVNLDNDPNLEIALQIWDRNTSTHKVIALDFTGTLVVRWETDIDGSLSYDRFQKGPSPAAGDINGDGTPDVVVAGSNNIYALDGTNGSLICQNANSLDLILASPAIADLDGDPSRLEVVALTVSGLLGILAYNGSGSWEWVYSITLDYGDDDGWATASPTIADCDDDGELEIIVVAGNGCPVEEPTAEPGKLFVLDGRRVNDLAWGVVPIPNYNPQPDPFWCARFYDASTMPPDSAIDRLYGIDPNLVSDTMVAVGELGISSTPQTPLFLFSYYSRDRGRTWNISSLTDPYPIDNLPSMGWEYHLYGVHLSKYVPGVQPRINGVAVGWALAKPIPFYPHWPSFWYGCILITTDGGKTWQDETGDLLGVSDPNALPRAPLTDAVIVTDGTDHRTWIVGLGGQVYTGRLTNAGLRQVNAPPTCYGDKAPYPDLYGVHAYYPYPGTVQNFIWVAGKCWKGGYIDWGYLNPQSMVWGNPPYCSDTVEYFCDAIYDLWAQGAQMPSLPGYSFYWNEAGITDSVFAVGKSVVSTAGQGVIFGTVDKLKSHEIEPYWQNRAFYDISTFEYPALRRYVFGEGPIRYWDVNFTKEDWLLPDEGGRITIKNDPTDPNPKGRILYGCADSYPLAVGEMNNLPCIWIKDIPLQKQPQRAPQVRHGNELLPALEIPSGGALLFWQRRLLR